MLPNKSKIELTYKSSDTEEFLDRIFYRKIGYGMAIAAKAIGVTPNFVTFLSTIFGMAAGHLFFYQDLNINLIGILLLMIAEALDGADGQLARMTNTFSRYGRIFDGVATNLAFVSIYLHLGARFIVTGGTPLIFIIILLAGISHSFQSAMSDYYRTFYFYFVHGKNKDIDDIDEVKESYSKLSWIKTPFKKFLLRIYINYMRQQSILAKNVKNLFNKNKDRYNNIVPTQLQIEYRKLNLPMIKYQNILTTNTRMIVLFISIFLNNTLYYYAFEIVILNLLLIYFLYKEENIHGSLLVFVKEKMDSAND